MKKALFFLGLVLLFLSSLAWTSSSSGSLLNMSGREFLTLFVISIIMMAPEIIYQVRRFFSSGEDHVPF